MKTFWKLLAALFIIAILVAFIGAFLLWSRMPDIASRKLSKTLGVSVNIGDIGLSPSRITVQNFDVGNPYGCKLSHALQTQEIDILAPILNYLKDDIVIDRIDMKNVYIGLEFDSPHGTKGNWATIMNNTERSQAASSSTSAEKTVLIRRLVLTNIQPDLLYRSEGKVRHLPTIPRIELVNISSKGGDLSDQLMNSALGQMVKEIFIKENLKDALDKIFKQIPGGGGSPVDLLKGFFGQAEEVK
jgi:uncharacterized protein involved in outer membrane biogenesis